jgi:hypothetical protein
MHHTGLDYRLAAAGDALYNVQPCGLGHVGSGILAGSLTKVSCFSRLRDMADYWVLEIRGRWRRIKGMRDRRA